MEEKKTGDTGAVHSVHYYYIKQSNIQVGGILVSRGKGVSVSGVGVDILMT